MKKKKPIMCVVRQGVRVVPVTYDLYADVVFLNNFTMDFLLLTILKRIMRLEKRKGGILAASVIGATYALAVTVYPFRYFWLQAVVTYCFISTVLAAVAFSIRRGKDILRAVAGLYISAVLMAGLLELFHFSGGFSWYLEHFIFREGWREIPFFVYFIAAGGGFFLVLYLWETVKEAEHTNGHLYAAVIFYQGRTKEVTAFLDTGNRLTDPFSHKPVSVIAADSCRDLFYTVSSISYIPYSSVGKKEGVLPAVKADRMELEKEGKKLVVDSPVIAISKEPLSKDGAYQMLLNEKLWF